MRGGLRWMAVAGCLAASIALGGTSLAQDAFNGERRIDLGEEISAEFDGHAWEVHRFFFSAPAGTKVSAALVRTSGDLVAELSLIQPGGQEIDLGKKLNIKKPESPKFNSFAILEPGVYGLQVKVGSGSGGYALTTKAKYGSKTKAADVSGEATFEAVAGSLVKLAMVKAARGSVAEPEITGLKDPLGFAVPVTVETRGKVSRFKTVALSRTGSYTVTWRNNGEDGAVDFQVVLKNPKPLYEELDLGLASGIPPTVVDTGDPVLAPREGYVGSSACGQCHGEILVNWASTAHNNAVRLWNKPGLTGVPIVADADGNGVNDFVDGYDLDSLDALKGRTNLAPDWVAYGANAPRLRYVAGDARPYKIIIGDITFDVYRLMGGNGMYKQRFLTKINDSYYILPVQFNEANQGKTGYKYYTVYNGTNWYDGSKNPLYTAANVSANIVKTKSFEANCSGCHNVGETVQVQGDGDFVTGYVEYNIGCEQCHGAGAAHVAANGDKSLILNPKNLLDGTAAGVQAANAVCARCHTRGVAKEAVTGSSFKPEYGYNQASGVQQVGDDQALFYSTIYDLGPTVPGEAAKMWGFQANPLAALPGATFLTSKNHHQQSLDMQFGPHAADKGYDANCFSCHDPHRNTNRHQVATRINEDGTADVATRQEDNSLCLSCHAGFGPFAALSKAQIAQIASGTPPVLVVAAVVDHMKDIGMPVDASDYDPTGTGVGNCASCHMPKASASAGNVKDRAGYFLGEVSSHTFQPIWPSASKKINATPASSVTNSCNHCHDPADIDDVAAKVIEEWATDSADADGTYHADTPRNFQNSVANAAGAGGGVACVSCHTTKGFVDVQVKGAGPFLSLTPGSGDETYRNETLKDSLRRYKGISCEACHGAQPDGTFAAGSNPLRFAKADLCGKCHNNQSVVFADFSSTGEMVRHPQREMLAGTAGSEVTGSYMNSAHSSTLFLPDGCVSCHYDKPQGGNHRFEPTLATCNTGACHGGALTSFNRPASGNFDGLNGTQGIQDEVTGLLDVLKAAILTQPSITFSGSGYFEYGGATDHKLTGATAAVKRAAFNWYSVSYDASKGIHNAPRTIQLLQRSYKEVTGVDVPGATLR